MRFYGLAGGGIHFLVGLGVNVGLGWIDYDCLFLLARMNVILEINFIIDSLAI
ncbi:TPA: hypothetical protein SE162_001207 [Campylobacter coli]|nr:hypothetical protein [Campylobacter coli]HEG2692032.1 hypothetical protein [Campylobacter coli]HEG5680001.1 hypothetical protein [Campylobacter coli]